MNTGELKHPTELEITEARYLPDHRLRIVASGQPAFVTSNFDHLQRGIAVLEDDPEAEFPWVFNLAYHLDGDDTNVQATNKIVGGTGNPVIVCLALRYQKAINENEIKAGPVEVPSTDEAQREMRSSGLS